MGIDALSPIAPAQINVLVVPAGNITQARYLSFVDRLRSSGRVRLGDLSSPSDSSKSAFNPAAFPSGSLLFNFDDVNTKLQTVESFPFELNKEPQVALALADGGRLDEEYGLQSLLDDLQVVHNDNRRLLLSQLVLFDVDPEGTDDYDGRVTFVPPIGKSNLTTMKTVMCDIASLYLSRLHDLAMEVQELPIIESPWKQGYSSASIENGARVTHRMTMPARSTSAKEGNELTLSSISPSISSRSPIGSRSGTPNGLRPASQLSREQSQDRMSTSTTVTDRKKNRTAGRVAVVLGGLYLQAGRWPDAVRELDRGFTTCRGMSDYLWHGRALELIVACLLMLGWADIPFQIPQACYPITDKSGKLNSSSLATSPPPKDTAEALQNLTKVLPDVFSTISTLYARAANFTQEQLPQIMLFETHIRMVNALSILQIRDGVLDDVALKCFVDGRETMPIDSGINPFGTISSRKHDISTLLNQAMSVNLEQLSHDEVIHVLNCLSSQLSLLGLSRKYAFFIRELISIIIPSLIHARKVGAAEMGIHPAAGLSALISMGRSGDSALGPGANGLRPLLKTMMDIYAVFDTDKSFWKSPIESMKERNRLNSIGDIALKVDVLRACLNICEALPDMDGIIYFSVQLLHTTKGTMLMPEPHAIGAPLIAPEEQMRLINVIKRTVEAASKLGSMDLAADYWDDFLVRDIEPLDYNPTMRLRPHSKKELDLVGAGGESKPKDPFIFNPFAKSTASTKDEITFVAGEPAYFRVTFQNPFDFEVEIDSLLLETDGCFFEPVQQSLLIGPYCLQKIVMSGTPRRGGRLSVKGVSAKIRGCRQKTFTTFKTKPKTDTSKKIKALGLAARDEKSGRPLSGDTSSPTKIALPLIPADNSLKVEVIEAQPLVTVKSSSLPQLALMVIEGESKTFEITLRNMSKNTPVDFLLFTFQDSATKQVQNALNNKELSGSDLYDLQLMLMEKPAMKLKSELNDSTSRINPGAMAKFVVEIIGNPGLLDGIIQIDYAHLDKDSGDEVPTKFHTRQLTIPLAVTVNAGLELVRSNILPFTGDFAWANQQNNQQSKISKTANSVRKSGNQFTSLLSRLGLGNYGNDHCLLLLDLRNGWPYPLTINVQVREQIPESDSESDDWSRAYGVHETIQPGHTSRSVLVVPRVFLQDPREAIPTLGNARQFVVSSSKISPEMENANKEAFWFREELLKHIRGSWVEESTGRRGFIDLRRALRLNARMIEALRIQDIEISMRVEPLSPVTTEKGEKSDVVQQTGRSRFTLKTNEFATLYTTIYNRSEKTIPVVLRLQPSLRDQPHTVALDLVKRFAWTGMLQQVVCPPIGPGEKRDLELGIMALCEGSYEIGGTVEELKLDSDTSKMMIVGQPQRRTWHAREPCMIDAKEGFLE